MANDSPKPIALDHEDTWPEPVRHLLEDSLAQLKAFEFEREESDASSSLAPRLNPHSSARRIVVAQVNEMTRDSALVGYHCTRLHEDEIADVIARGLRPQSTEFATEQIRRRQRAGDLSEDLAERLLAGNLAKLQKQRNGQIWFVFSESLLRSESGLFALLSPWGGEALSQPLYNDPEALRILRSLGTPCIVKAAVRLSSVNLFASFGQRVVTSFLARRDVPTQIGSEVEGYAKEAVPGESILEIIRLGHPRFETLTESSQWQDRLRIS